MTEREVQRNPKRLSRAPTDAPQAAHSSESRSAHQQQQPFYPKIVPERRIPGHHVNQEPNIELPSRRSETINPVSDMAPASVVEREASLSQRQVQIHSTAKKRPYTAIQETMDERVTQSPRLTSPPSPISESFAYVTDRGEYRCALCMSQLVSQEALNKHETMSKLHISNLKDFSALSKGRQKLAQVTAIPPRQYDQSPSRSFKPIQVEDLNQHQDSNVHNEHVYNVGRTDNNNQYQPDQQESRENSISEMIEVLPHSPVSSSLHIDVNAINSTRSISPESAQQLNKGKTRALTSPPQIAFAVHNSASLPPPPFRPPPLHSEAQPYTSKVPAVDKDTDYRNGNPTESGSIRKNTLPATEVAEILLSAGLKLAEKCLETHPDLIAEYLSQIRQDRDSASRTTSFGNTSMTSSSTISSSNTLATAKARIAGRYGEARRGIKEKEQSIGEVIIVDLD